MRINYEKIGHLHQTHGVIKEKVRDVPCLRLSAVLEIGRPSSLDQ